MISQFIRPVATLCVATLSAALCAAPLASAQSAEKLIAVVGARVFDGERLLPRATVVFSNQGKILAVGESVAPPAGAEVVDGQGQTLLPGLIDAHTQAFPGSLERALVFGVTTELDMFSDQAWAARIRQEQGQRQAQTVELALIEDGAERSQGALAISGEIRQGFPFPWSGAIFFPGAVPMTPVDLSAAKELVFWARGEGGPYRVMMFSSTRQRVPQEQTFTVEKEWREIVLPLASFPGLDPKALMGLLFSGTMQPGRFRFDIDGVSFR